MRNESEQAKNTCCIFLHFLNDKKWEEACQLLSEDFEAYLPQLKEDIIGPDNFIELIRLNLDNHKIQIQDTTCEYDQWGKEFKVVTRVHIESKMTDEKVLKLFKISFFTVDREGFIKSIIEYRANMYNSQIEKFY